MTCPTLTGAKAPILVGGSQALIGSGFIRLIFSGSLKLSLNMPHFTIRHQWKCRKMMLKREVGSIVCPGI